MQRPSHPTDFIAPAPHHPLMSGLQRLSEVFWRLGNRPDVTHAYRNKDYNQWFLIQVKAGAYHLCDKGSAPCAGPPSPAGAAPVSLLFARFLGDRGRTCWPQSRAPLLVNAAFPHCDHWSDKTCITDGLIDPGQSRAGARLRYPRQQPDVRSHFRVHTRSQPAQPLRGA